MTVNINRGLKKSLISRDIRFLKGMLSAKQATSKSFTGAHFGCFIFAGMKQRGKFCSSRFLFYLLLLKRILLSLRKCLFFKQIAPIWQWFQREFFTGQGVTLVTKKYVDTWYVKMRICIQVQGAWIMLLNKKCPYNLQYSIQMEKLPFDQLLAISRDRRNRSKTVQNRRYAWHV